MKKLFAVLTLLLVMIFGIGAPQTAQAAFEEKPVGFVVIDKSGNLDMPTYKEWRTVTKWAYRFPNYKLVENGLPQEIVGNVYGVLDDGGDALYAHRHTQDQQVCKQ